MSTEREIAEQMIKDAEKLIAEAKAKLAELDKPEPLMHGDYGFSKCGDACMSLKLHDGNGNTIGEGRAGDRYAYTVLFSSDDNENFLIKTKLGNIFDDLAELAEPLEKYSMGGSEHPFHSTIKVGLSVDPEDAVFIRIEEEGCRNMCRLKLDNFEIFCKNGLRIIATAKKKQKS